MSKELDTDRLEVFARSAVAEHGLPDAELTLLNVSENATYQVDAGDGRRFALRVHRPGYHSKDAIASELAWIQALRDDDVVRTAPVIATPDGRQIVTGVHPDGDERFAVAFGWLEGTEPPEDRLVADFAQVGAITARLHRHSRNWSKPAGFTRLRWDCDTALGAEGHWGRWQDGMGMGAGEIEVLSRSASLVQRRLAAFGDGPDRFGLIHADMRLANLLVDGPDVSVIDFDDCGFSWYLYDLGSSLSFIEHHPVVPELIDSWVRGYLTEGTLTSDEIAELPTFVMLRRMLLVAWVGSHAEVPEAQRMGPEFTAVSCDLAEAYLAKFG